MDGLSRQFGYIMRLLDCGCAGGKQVGTGIVNRHNSINYWISGIVV